ncbi:hypothetical protein H3Z85_04130 [Chryseobacterium indologenes]|uniref:hypothetical protein n=1 Tax=Chryseobacterium indologenes TaxID=253 RepID=UPI0003E06F09|nr:hypothetical protein [Chryseobacterium indologenes]QPQ52648.1 hypothetical protein H3Z85_04130 [Chryseobacterium indologenes]GAE66863.1 hypothetical protein CIN01S_19_00810 [Chryseobacterium indologenes NBRC 14944]SFJ77315.1 hypothetical protein SAMN05421692_2444 [Chryseobacterium indologenes]SUX51348.1 Uncharacterised protein [Chryseobacterium indologenes]
MGIFDFFKKKNSGQENSSIPVQQFEAPNVEVAEPETEVEEMTEEMVETIPSISLEPVQEKKINEEFEKIKIYNEYIVHAIALQLRGEYTPISAFEKENGEIEGFVYAVTEDAYAFSPEQAIAKMEEKFENELNEGKIRSYMILYHSQFEENGHHTPAMKPGEFKAISLSYHCKGEDKKQVGLPYVFENENITYKGFAEFSHEENNEIMNTQLVDGKNYFPNTEGVQAPETTNEAGIIIRKSNVHNLSHIWGGIFGHENFQTKDYSGYMSPLTIPDPSGEHKNKAEFKDVRFKTIFADEVSTIIPEVKTDYTLDFETRSIREWEHAQDLHAIVAGPARDSFGVWFFATDYAENKNTYLTQPHLKVNISGIVFVLEINQNTELPDGTKMTEDFTTYAPSQDLPNYACFDFIGQLIDFRETELLEDGSVKGYILKLKLLTNGENEDFFTIDAFVNKENMRFETLTKGMKLIGALQLQGKIAAS